MKNIAAIFFLLISCQRPTVSHKIEIGEECKPSSIFLLKNNFLLNDFFVRIDSIKSVQRADSDSTFFMDMNKRILLEFIDDINIEKFNKENSFSKEYQLLPGSNKPGTIDIEFYVDECKFRISITCKTIIDSDTIDEGTISYSFKIFKGKIIFLKRNASG